MTLSTRVASSGRGCQQRELTRGRPAPLEARRRARPGLLPQGHIAVRVTQSIDRGRGQTPDVEERDEEPVLTVGDHFAHGRGVRSDHQTARAHRLDQRPRQDEGVGQVDMRPADLEKAQVLSVGQGADEVHPARVDPPGDLGAVGVLPAAPIGGGRSVRHGIPTDDDDLCLGTRPEDLRQGTHEHVVAAQRLEIAGDEGQDFGLRVEAIARGKVEHGIGVGAHRLGVDALMGDGDLAVELARIGRALPLGRREAEVAFGERQQLARVLGPEIGQAVDPELGEFRVEMDVLALLPVKVFAVDDQSGPRKLRAQRQRLAPAAMGHDHVGDEARSFEGVERVEHLLGPARLGIEPAREGMDRGVPDILEMVALQPHATDAARRLRADRGDPVRGIGDEGLREVAELGREVRMDEQDVHGADHRPWSGKVTRRGACS